LTNPDLVATDEDTAWATAFWFWKTNVGKLIDVKNGRFGASTKAINGGIECNPGGKNLDAAKKRYNIYKNVLAQFGDNKDPIENGCYS
jgi:predicted chitinase